MTQKPLSLDDAMIVTVNGHELIYGSLLNVDLSKKGVQL